MTESASDSSNGWALRIAAGIVLVCDIALTLAIILLDRFDHVAPPKNGGVDSSHPIGWLGVFGAVFIFGCYGILIKTPAITNANVDPMVFQAYYSAGVCVVSAVIWVAAGSSHGFVFSWLGILFAAIWISSQVFGFKAIQAVGYAVGPSIWAALTIIVSFFWGVAAFSNPIQSIAGSVVALALLVCGICLAAASSVAPARLGAFGIEAREVLTPFNDGDSAEAGGTSHDYRDSCKVALAHAQVSGSPDVPLGLEEPANVQEAVSGGGKLVGGFLCAIGCGLFNGSLMVPMTCFQNGSALLNIDKYAGEGIAPIAFLPSLVIGLVIVQPMFFLGYFARTFASGRCPEFHLSVALGPGLLTGAFWGMGNFAAMFASTYLGQTVGFPLTQTCIIVNGFWGILFYKEIKGPLPIGLFVFAAIVIISGAYLDGTYG